MNFSITLFNNKLPNFSSIYYTILKADEDGISTLTSRPSIDHRPSHGLAHTFKFKSYSPKVFDRIRTFFGFDPESYMYSVCGDFNFIEFISNSKSGQFFFYTHDGKFMIKTQTKDESRWVLWDHVVFYMFSIPCFDTFLSAYMLKWKCGTVALVLSLYCCLMTLFNSFLIR